MRNYFFSIAVHIILLLLLLGLSFATVKNEPKPERQVIMVDFSHQEVTEKPVPETTEPEEQPKRKKSKVPSPQKEAPKKEVAKAKKVKTFDKKPLQTSQKPNAESSKVLDEKSTVVKKVIPLKDPKPTAEQIAEAKRKKKKAEKLAQFKSLLSKAKIKTAADQNQPETSEEVTGSNASTFSNSKSSTSKNKNIQGVLGNRRVLKTPTIKDKSQKKGRVVVKICVDKSGKVVSSKYTMMGSTTSDTYLITLAETGAQQYLFSASDNPKECGNVIIDFQLK